MAIEKIRGSITKRGPDHYRLRYPRGKGRDNKRLSPLSRDFHGSYDQAIDALRALGTAYEMGKATPDRMTLRTFIEDRYLPFIESGIAARTRKPYALRTKERYTYALRKHVMPHLGEMRLSEIQLADVEWLSETLRSSGLTGSTVGDTIAVMKAAFKFAMRHKLITENPCAELTTPSRKAERELPAFSRELAVQVIELAAPTRFRLAAILAFGQALRREEILGLRWSDVDLERGTLIVRRALVAFRRPSPGERPRPVWKEPKTEKSARTIPIFEEFLEDFRAERRAQMRMRMQLGSAWRGAAQQDDDQVVAMEDGRPWRPDAYSTAWRRFLAKQAPFLPRLTTKDGRASWVSIAYPVVGDPKLLAEWAGHSERVAQARYQQTLEESARIAKEKLNLEFRRGSR